MPRWSYRAPSWTSEPQHGLSTDWTTVGGRTVRSLSAGTVRDLPELVVLPGLGAPFYLLPWVALASRWTRVTVLDLPGFHGGRARSSPATVSGVADVAAGWLTATGRRGIVLFGHSSGAQSAARTAVLVPELVAGVVLAGPTVDAGARSPLRLPVRVVRTLRHEVLPELRAVAPSYLRSGGISLARLISSAVLDRPEDVITGLRHPLLVTTGEQDRLASPAWTQRLADSAGGAHGVTRGAHNACFTFPQEVDELVHRTVRGWSEVPAAGGHVDPAGRVARAAAGDPPEDLDRGRAAWRRPVSRRARRRSLAGDGRQRAAG